MSLSSDVRTPASPSLRSAVTRVRAASGSFLAAEDPAGLPLGEFLVDELRAAALRMLALLSPGSADPVAAMTLECEQRVLRAVCALSAIDVHELTHDSRLDLTRAVAGIHATLHQRREVDVTRAFLDATPAGSTLAELVFEVDPDELDPDAQVSYCQAAQRLESAAHARLGAGLLAFAGTNPRATEYWVDGEVHELADVRASELASALTWSDTRARNAVASARTVAHELESAGEAASRGSLQPAVLGVIAEGAQLLTSSIDREIEQARAALRHDTDSADDVAQRVWELTSTREELVQRFDRTLTAFASSHTVAETRRKVRDTVARLDPSGFAQRRETARQTQSAVELRPLPDSMAMLTAVMPAERATACFRAIDSAAHDDVASDATAPVGLRRADALFAFCAQVSPTSGGSANGSQREDCEPAQSSTAHVDLVMTLDAFLGLSETPAECVGAGPIPAQAARTFLAAAELVSVRRILVDSETGHTLDVGARRYALTDAERDYIFARDRTCRRPGCHQPAHRCECDHAVPFHAGGPTRSDNLGALCLRHHQEKTHGGWSIDESASDGSCVFVSPLGRRYEHRAEPLLPWAELREQERK